MCSDLIISPLLIYGSWPVLKNPCVSKLVGQVGRLCLRAHRFECDLFVNFVVTVFSGL